MWGCQSYAVGISYSIPFNIVPYWLIASFFFFFFLNYAKLTNNESTFMPNG